MRKKTASLLALVLLAGLLPLSALPAATAQEGPPLPLPDPVVVPYQITGPASQRMNLIVLGDGYQWDQQSLFFEDADRNLAIMWATEPYKSYRNYMNVFLVSIASIDYGTRCDPDGRVRHPDGTIRDTGVREGPINTKNTAIRMIFSNGCNDPLARGTVYTGAPPNCASYAAYYPPGVNPCETGSQAHNRIIDNFVVPVMGIPRTSQNVQSLAIFNTFTYGGIGGSNATASGGSPQGPLISLHELGHSHGSMQDEYPYSSRDVVRPCNTGTGEPGSFHHTRYTDTAQMVADQHKWWRWIGEESLSGGPIGLHEGGMSFPCGYRRPSQHSIMRWIGNEWDQPGLEHMVARITGLRNTGQMPVNNRPTGTVPRDSVLWVEAPQPKSHDLSVTWRVGGAGGTVLDTNNSRNLDLGPLALAPGTVVHVEVRDPVGPDGIDWVRNPSTSSATTNSGYNGSRFVQTRQWTVGESTVTPSTPAAEITVSSLTNLPVAGDEWVFVHTNHPADRVLDVAWYVDDAEIPNPHNARNIHTGSLGLEPGTYSLRAVVTDPADPDVSDSREWVIDNVDPTAPRILSESLTTLAGDLEHPVYFGGWDMWLYPEDDQTGYSEELYVVGNLRLNNDGWFSYFGFPEEPMPDSPFEFRHSGQDVKALTYGNLGSGGLSKATFEQYFDGHPSGTFEPGYGTHFVEHRGIDPAGNISDPEAYRATVLPHSSPECTNTISSNRTGHLNVNSGVTCVEGGVSLNGGVTVRNGASLVLSDGSIVNGGLNVISASVVQAFGARVNGDTSISGAADLILAGNDFHGDLTLTGNSASDVTILSGATRNYGVLVIGNSVSQDLSCSGNTPFVDNFDVPNSVGGTKSGQCADL